MKKKVISIVLATAMTATLATGMGSSTVLAADSTHVTNENIKVTDAYKGKTLSMILSQGWADERLDEVIDWFEEDYGVTVDVQFVDAANYTSVLQAKLTEGECADIFWIQSDSFTIADYATYCEDLTGSWWKDVMPETRQASCTYEDKLLGLQLWHNSPEWSIVYNKTLLKELGYDAFPTTYADLDKLCKDLKDNGIDTPWFNAGSDGWYAQLPFFQIGGVYEAATPGLYDSLNNNTATFAENEKMLEVLNQYKELADNGYFGEGWISATYTDSETALLDRECGFTTQNGSFVDTLVADGAEDEFGIALCPLGDNSWYPTNAQGPTMFVYNKSENVDLAKEFMGYICDTACLQSMLDNWTGYSNIDVTDANVEQHWGDAEKEFMDTMDTSKMSTSVLQVGTRYTNSAWNDFGNDLIAMCQGTLTADQVLENMDGYRAELAKTAGDENWK